MLVGCVSLFTCEDGFMFRKISRRHIPCAGNHFNFLNNRSTIIMYRQHVQTDKRTVQQQQQQLSIAHRETKKKKHLASKAKEKIARQTHFPAIPQYHMNMNMKRDFHCKTIKNQSAKQTISMLNCTACAFKQHANQCLKLILKTDVAFACAAFELQISNKFPLVGWLVGWLEITKKAPNQKWAESKKKHPVL